MHLGVKGNNIFVLGSYPLCVVGRLAVWSRCLRPYLWTGMCLPILLILRTITLVPLVSPIKNRWRSVNYSLRLMKLVWDLTKFRCFYILDGV
jgi:hypothetical protein